MPGQTSAAQITFVPPLQTCFEKLGFTSERMEKIFRWSVRSISAWSLAQIQRAFKYTQAQPGGGAWVALSDKWVAKKQLEGKSDLIGTYMGHLSGSFTGSTDPLTVTTADAVEINQFAHIAHIGTEIEYGGKFNDGFGFQPARPFIPADSHVTNHWQALHARILEHPELIPNV